MKTLNSILFAAALAGTLSLANNTNAQVKVNEDEGIAASPKVRQMLNEQKAMSKAAPAPASVAAAPVSCCAAIKDGVAASPKVRQTLNEWKVVTSPATATVASTSAGYQPTGADGITASPRVRQQLNERGTSFAIAPVK